MIRLITERDNLIVKDWFEPYKYASIEMIEKAFFRHQKASYNIVRKRLGRLKELNQIKVVRDLATNKNIYLYNDTDGRIKPPSLHRIILLNILAEMKYSGFSVELFDIEKAWMNGKVIPDAFSIFTVNNRRYHFFIEVQLSNNPHNLKKYDELYNSGEVQKYLGKDFFPRVLLVSDRIYTIKLEHAQVLNLNLSLDSFSTILL